MRGALAAVRQHAHRGRRHRHRHLGAPPRRRSTPSAGTSVPGDHRVICVGAGATAAVHLLQQILGVYLPPAGRDAFARIAAEVPRRRRASSGSPRTSPAPTRGVRGPLRAPLERGVVARVLRRGGGDRAVRRRPAGPPRPRGEARAAPTYRGRRLIGAFSAASNVTGVETPAHEVAAILHDHGALACFDYAASAPYESIDVDRDGARVLRRGVLLAAQVRRRPGRRRRAGHPPAALPGRPSADRRRRGHGGLRQLRRAGVQPRHRDPRDAGHSCHPADLPRGARDGAEGPARPRPHRPRERDLVARVEAALGAHPSVELMGGPKLARGLPIFSLNVRVGGSWLHPRFVTTLLNDLFGIQTRAGCSCAAPYGHRLLHIDTRTSDRLHGPSGAATSD